MKESPLLSPGRTISLPRFPWFRIFRQVVPASWCGVLALLFTCGTLRAEDTAWKAFGERLMTSAPENIRNGSDLDITRFVAHQVANKLAAEGVPPNASYTGRLQSIWNYGVQRVDRGSCGDIATLLEQALRGAGVKSDLRGIVAEVGGLGQYNLADVNRDHGALALVSNGRVYLFDLWQYGRAQQTFAGFGLNDPWNGIELPAWEARMRTQGYRTISLVDGSALAQWVEIESKAQETRRKIAQDRQKKSTGAAPEKVDPNEVFLRLPDDLRETGWKLIGLAPDLAKEFSGRPVPQSASSIPGATNFGQQRFAVSPDTIKWGGHTDRWDYLTDYPLGSFRWVDVSINLEACASAAEAEASYKKVYAYKIAQAGLGDPAQDEVRWMDIGGRNEFVVLREGRYIVEMQFNGLDSFRGGSGNFTHAVPAILRKRLQLRP